MQYKEISKFPGIHKDIAFVVNKKIPASDIMSAIKKEGGRLLKNISIFDVYEGEKLADDEKSVAFALTFEDQTRTLNEEEVMEIFNRIIVGVENKLNAKVRDK